MSEILGINTREVWDRKLSIAGPTIYTGSGGNGEKADKTWIIEINAHENPDYIPEDVYEILYKYNDSGDVIEGSEHNGQFLKKANKPSAPLETIVTDIPCEHGDLHNLDKFKKCFEILKSKRDQYSRPNIEELKPKVAIERIINDDLHRVATAYAAEYGHLSKERYLLLSAQYAVDLQDLEAAMEAA